VPEPAELEEPANLPPPETAGAGAARPRVAVVQDGARLHYALPVALRRAGLLGAVFVEWFVARGSREQKITQLVDRFDPALATRLAARCCPQLEGARVVTNPWLALRQAGRRRRLAGAAYDAWSAARVSRWVRRRGFGGCDGLTGFIRNLDPGLIVAARERGLSTVADQIIAPAAVEIEELRRQQARWPGWQRGDAAAELEPYLEWESRSWAALDRITYPSPYVREGLLGQGVPAERIAELPYPIEAGAFPFVDRSVRPARGRAALTVGFVGAVSLRKGAPYFLEVARRLAAALGDRVRFVMLGPVQLDPGAVDRHRGAVEMPGSVPRPEIRPWLGSFDVFLFPSTCEGSTQAVAEAMCSGLPVVTTVNSGSVARNGREGFVLPYDDTAGLAERVRELLEDGPLRLRMGAAARARAEEFGIDRYSRGLAELWGSVAAGGSLMARRTAE
jgi:glycosyltransferase involved in cell wall biosynthesis